MNIEFNTSDLNGFNTPNQHKIIGMFGEKLAEKNLSDQLSIELFSLNEQLLLCELNNDSCFKIVPVSSTDVISLFERV